MRQHHLTYYDDVWSCSVCKWAWLRKPISECPGLPRYEFDTRPDHLVTRNELRRRGLRLPRDGSVTPAAVIYGDHSRTQERVTLLYDARQATPATPLTPAQLAARRRNGAARHERAQAARDGR